MKQTVPIRILIVEDFHAETDALLIELRDVDMLFEQEVVKNEKQYQDALATFEPDVILSPYSLKGTNAIKLLGIAKKAGVDAPFILLAFDLSEDIAIDLLGEGIEDYVQHSTLKRLPVAIKKALQRYKTQLELKISESRLKTSEESLRNMVKNTPIAVAMFDQQMNYLVVSDAWLKHENRKEKELIGNNHYDIVPELPEHWKKIHQEVLGGKTHESNSETMMRSNGSSEILRWRMNPWYTSEGAVGGAVLFIENITDTIQAQLRVERNEHLLAIGEELGHSGSFEFDIATQTPVWSRNMYKIKGFELGADISHESYIKHIHPEDKDHYLDAYVQITQSVAPTLFEYRIFRPDNGKLVHLKVHSSFITNEAGEPTALMGSVQDITESVQARTSLEESEASLKSAQQIAKIGSWTLNPTDNSVTWTKELFAIHEIKEQKLEVELIRSFTHPEDLGLFDNGFQQLASGSDTDFVYRIITPAGKVKHVRGVGKVAKLENGQIESMSGTVQDVSQETTSRLELEKAQESLEIAQDIANVGSWEWCKGDQSLTISKQVLAIYETKKKQLSLDEIRSFIHPDDQKRVAKETANDFNKKIKPVIEYRLVTEKGNIKQVITSARQITNSDGKIVKLVGTVQDVTERRVMEKELEELQRNMLTRMETRVAERTTELEEKNRELRKEVWENQRISDELYHHNLDLKDSIEYAKRIQESILPDEKLIQQSFGHGFVLFLPRDVVSGDFYWYFKRDNLSYFAAIDCTGHGVPGALMSMIANELMNQAVIQKKLTDPGEVLSLLNKLMIRTLRQKQENHMRDGMDLSLIVVNHDTDTLRFSGALASMYVADKGKLSLYPGNRHSIGGHLEDVKKTFETTEIKIKKGDTIYLSTDGYIDQFGGPEGKKLMKKRFAEFLESIQNLPLDEQKDALLNKFEEWKGPLNQVDDVLVAGLSY